ncbi:MAG: SDR family NAD-dependent epimerase/dehydratase, partial [Bacteroidales bacterium]|nr:SDR family NAD-dependent epimerase/dehydratase [Bacteroidales bacterium]
MTRMMETDESFIGPVNIGNPHEFTILELAEKVIALTGSASKLIRKPLPSDDPTQRRPDIRLAKERLDWEPHIQLEEGLKKTIAYFEQQLKTI